MKQIYNKFISSILAIAVFMLFVPVQTNANTVLPSNTTGPATGVQSASSTALDVNVAVELAGEETSLDRMMVMYRNTCVATTTSGIHDIGAGALFSVTISGQSASSTVYAYDALLQQGEPIYQRAIGHASSTASVPQDIVGASYTNGLYLHLSGTGLVVTVCRI